MSDLSNKAFRKILSTENIVFTEEEIIYMLDTELEKSEYEIDTEIIDICIDALKRMRGVRVAVVGSRHIKIENLGKYLPENTTEIVSGGAKGVDTSAREYALANKIKLTEILPDYKKYGRVAPLKRNDLIINYADMVIVFWDGKSHGTKYVIDYCKKNNKKIIVNLIK